MEDDKKKIKPIIVENLKYLVFYSLSLVIALGINEVITKIFSKYYKDSIFPRILYIVILISVTIWFAYVTEYNPNNN